LPESTDLKNTDLFAASVVSLTNCSFEKQAILVPLRIGDGDHDLSKWQAELASDPPSRSLDNKLDLWVQEGFVANVADLENLKFVVTFTRDLKF
jgi:hypothetical protein